MNRQTSSVEDVHLLAHSRGPDVLLDAGREWDIEAIAAGIEPADAGNVRAATGICGLDKAIGGGPCEARMRSLRGKP